MQRVSEKAIRELINEALDGGIEPSSLVDKTQLAQGSLKTIKKHNNERSIDSSVIVKNAANAASDEEGLDMKFNKKIEEAIRKEVRKIISEMKPNKFVDPADVAADEDEEIERRKMNTMSDVGGATFQEIADELGFAVSGAKQAVDKALTKAQFVASMDQDELEVLVLQSMGDYIDKLARTGELSPEDVQLMKAHPDIVRELDGFREFLDRALRKTRKNSTGSEE